MMRTVHYDQVLVGQPGTTNFNFLKHSWEDIQIWLFMDWDLHLIICVEGVPLVTEVTWEGPLITVAKPDVDLQSR